MTSRSFIVSLGVLLVSIFWVASIASRGEPTVIETNLEKLPMKIDSYEGREEFFSDSVYKELNADKHVYRQYFSRDGKRINLYIGYYGTKKGGRTGHNPYACLPGAGWGLIDSKKERVRVSYYPDGIEVNYLLARKGETYQTVFHWYQADGQKIVASGIEQNVQRFVGRVFHNRNDGAFVQVSAFSGEEQIGDAKSYVKSFAETLLEILPNYWPVER